MMKDRMKEWMAQTYIHPITAILLGVTVTLTLFSQIRLGLEEQRVLVILEGIAIGFRFSAAVTLIFISIYLQHATTAGTPIPAKYRWPSFAVGVVILDRAREGSYFPFHDAILVIFVYISLTYLAWNGFVLVLDSYDLKRPRAYISDLVMSAVDDWTE